MNVMPQPQIAISGEVPVRSPPFRPSNRLEDTKSFPKCHHLSRFDNYSTRYVELGPGLKMKTLKKNCSKDTNRDFGRSASPITAVPPIKSIRRHQELSKMPSFVSFRQLQHEIRRTRTRTENEDIKKNCSKDTNRDFGRSASPITAVPPIKSIRRHQELSKMPSFVRNGRTQQKMCLVQN